MKRWGCGLLPLLPLSVPIPPHQPRKEEQPRSEAFWAVERDRSEDEQRKESGTKCPKEVSKNTDCQALGAAVATTAAAAHYSEKCHPSLRQSVRPSICPVTHLKQSAAVSSCPLEGVCWRGSSHFVTVTARCHRFQGGRVEALLRPQRVRLHLHTVGQEGGVGVAVGHQQFKLGDPALADDAAGVGAHVRRDGVHLALLEARRKVLAVDWRREED